MTAAAALTMPADEAIADYFRNLDIALARRLPAQHADYLDVQIETWLARGRMLGRWKSGPCPCPKPFDTIGVIETIRYRLIAMRDEARAASQLRVVA